jgi:hypothetical protein
MSWFYALSLLCCVFWTVTAQNEGKGCEINLVDCETARLVRNKNNTKNLRANYHNWQIKQ